MISQLETLIQKIPVLSAAINRCARALSFDGSKTYWERRYATGGNSGAGSYGRLATFKAEILNQFVSSHQIESVVEFGCGDGNQLSLASYPNYLGLDVAEGAIAACSERFANDTTKRFRHYDPQQVTDWESLQADLSVSLDVIYHLVEDEVFHTYLTQLFGSASRFVIVYSSNIESIPPSPHVRHRRFTDWVETHATHWELVQHIPNRFPYDSQRPDDSSFADFFVFSRRTV